MEVRTKLCQIANTDGTFAVEIGACAGGGLAVRARSWRGRWGAWRECIADIKFPDEASCDDICGKIRRHPDLELSAVLEADRDD